MGEQECHFPIKCKLQIQFSRIESAVCSSQQARRILSQAILIRYTQIILSIQSLRLYVFSESHLLLISQGVGTMAGEEVDIKRKSTTIIEKRT